MQYAELAESGRHGARNSKRLTLRVYQLKTGHWLTGQYLHWAKNRRTAHGWWCRYRTKIRDHLFKVCPEWKAQVQEEESGKGRAGSGSATSLPMGGAARRYKTSSPLRM